MNDHQPKSLPSDVPPPPPGASGTSVPPSSAVPSPPSVLEGPLPPPQHGTGAGEHPRSDDPSDQVTVGSSSAAITLPSLSSGDTPITPAGGGPELEGRGRRELLLIGVVVLVVVGLLGAGVVALLTGDGEVPVAATRPSTEEIEELETEFDTASSEVAEQLGETTETPEPQRTQTSVFELSVGTCFDDAESGDELFTVLEVPCSEPHDNEVYALITHPAGAGEPYPGAGELDTFAREQCQGEAFTAYVGVSYLDSQYHSSQIRPTEASWGTGDREIVCVLWGLEKLVGSVEGTAE